MARGDGKAQRGHTRGKGVIKMAAGGNLAARDAAMGGSPVGSRAEATRSTSPSGVGASRSSLGASTREGGFGGAGGEGRNVVNTSAKSDRLGPSQLGPGAFQEYANQRMAAAIDSSGAMRAPQTVNTAAKSDFTPSQTVNTAAKGDLLSTQPPIRAINKPGVASQFRTLESAGLGAYTSNKMPGAKSSGTPFGGFGVNQGPQTDIGDLIAGVRSNQPRGTPVSDAAEYYSSLPSRAKLEGLREPNRVASYMGEVSAGTGPRSSPSSAPYGGQTTRAEPSGSAAPAQAAPKATVTPTAAPAPKPNIGAGSNFMAGPIPGGRRSDDDRPRRRKKKPIADEGASSFKKGGRINGAALRGWTKGKLI